MTASSYSTQGKPLRDRALLPATLAVLLIPGLLVAGEHLALPQSRDQAPRDDFKPFILLSQGDTASRIAAVERALEARDYDRAAQLLQSMIRESAHEIVSLDEEKSGFRSFAGASAYAESRLLEGPTALRAAYQRCVGSEAATDLARAQRLEDREGLRRVLRIFGASKSGARAAVLLGDLALERGDLDAAQFYYRSAARHEGGRDRAALIARRWLARARTGTLPREKLPPNATPTIAGRRAPPEELEALVVKQAREQRARNDEEHPVVAVPSSEGIPPRIDPELEIQWQIELPASAPFARMSRAGLKANLVPVVHRGTVLVTDSLRAYGIDLFSGPDRGGKPLWASARSEGMTDSAVRDQMKGINLDTILAGAAGEGIFVAPLQVNIPQAEDRFRNLLIRAPIPTRRLFAFDVATGRQLWSHWNPQLVHTEIAGLKSFLDRSRVAGPPVISGNRVIVPMFVFEARIKFFVAAFDLQSGATLWYRYLVTGQKEMNMFGNVTEAFSAPPVLVRDQVVYAVSNLGAVAALDLLDGRLRWVSTYHQIPLPSSMGMIQARRSKVWINQPPLLAGDALVCTPVDSDYLCAFDAQTGRCLTNTSRWSFNDPDHGGYHTLLYADGRRILIGRDDALMRLPHPAPKGMLRRRLPGIFSELDYAPRGAKPRAAVTADRLYLSVHNKLYAIDLSRGGAPRRSMKLEGREFWSSNAILADGILLLSTNRAICACFNRNVVERSIRERARDGDLLDRLRYTQFLARSARREFERGEVLKGEQILQRAEALLAKDREEPSARGALARLSLLGAEIYTRRKRPELAIQRCRKVLELTRDGEMRWQALRTLEALLRSSDDTSQRYLDCLDQLERECPERRFEIDGSQLSVGAYVAWRRYWHARGQGDPKAQIAALRRILLDYPAEVWEGDPSGARARATIAALIEIHGRKIYAPYEREARNLLQRAGPQRRPEELEAIAAAYPNAEITGTILLGLIETGARDDNPMRSCRAARAALSSRMPEARVLRRLALAFNRLGSSAIAAGIMRRLASWYPAEKSDLPADDGRSFRDLQPQPRTLPLAPGPRDPRHMKRVDVPWSTDGYRTIIHPLGEDPAARNYVFIQRNQTLFCYSPTANRTVLQERWLFNPPHRTATHRLWQGRVAVHGDHVIIASERALTWLLLQDGKEQATLPLPAGSDFARLLAGQPPLFYLSSGVVLLVTRPDIGTYGAEESYNLHAFDAASARPLWSLRCPVALRAAPLVGQGHIALIGKRASERATRFPLVILDLYTGWLRTRLDLEGDPSTYYQRRPRAGLILGDHLFLRHASQDPGIACIALREGRVLWKDTSPALVRENRAGNFPWYLIGCRSKLYAAVSVASTLSDRYRIVRIDTLDGRLSSVANLDADDRIHGFGPNNDVFELARPQLVVWHKDRRRASSSAQLPEFSIFDLDSGQRFSPRNAAAPGLTLTKSTYTSLPAPLLTERMAFLAFQCKNRAGNRKIYLRAFDARYGQPLMLPEQMPGNNIAGMALIGDSIVVAGIHRTLVFR